MCPNVCVASAIDPGLEKLPFACALRQTRWTTNGAHELHVLFSLCLSRDRSIVGMLEHARAQLYYPSLAHPQLLQQTGAFARLAARGHFSCAGGREYLREEAAVGAYLLGVTDFLDPERAIQSASPLPVLCSLLPAARMCTAGQKYPRSTPILDRPTPHRSVALSQ